jgi:murein DD-endopeptidase MepM/ murein hydrolase activator NlpD
MACSTGLKIFISYPNVLSGDGCYGGFTIPQGFNSDTMQFVSNRYSHGGNLVGFRPGLRPPADGDYYNGGNSFATKNFNIVLNNYEDAKFFTGNRMIHDFSRKFEVNTPKLQISREKNSPSIGTIELQSKQHPELITEKNYILNGVSNGTRYAVVEIERDGVKKAVFGRVEKVLGGPGRQNDLEMKLFDINDFYIKSTNKEGQSNKDQNTSETSKETTLFGGMPRKDNIYFDWDVFSNRVDEVSQSFLNPDQSFPPTPNTMNKIKDKLLNDFVFGSDKEQGIFYSYGIGQSKLTDYIATGRPTPILGPLITKDNKEMLRTYRNAGDLLDVFSSYFVYHMREPNQINTMEVIQATNAFDETTAKDAYWAQTDAKNWGIGYFLIDTSELPQTGFKKFTTSTEEFGTGLDEMFRLFDVKIKWRMELRQIDGLTRAVLIPYQSSKTYTLGGENLSRDWTISMDNEEIINLASSFRTLNKEHDGNSEYHGLANVEKDFYRDLVNYETFGVYPYNSKVASESAVAVGKVANLEQKTDSELGEIKERLAFVEYNCCNENGGGGETGGGGGQGTGEFGNPNPRGSITQAFGCTTYAGAGYPSCNGCRWHNGIDIAGGLGTQILSADDGRVFFAGFVSGWGNLVKINHGDKDTWYAHLSRIDVSSGQNVTKGQVIGLEGSTGNSSGSHLHFGVHRAGESSWCSALDPNDYVQFGRSLSVNNAIEEEREVIVERELPALRDNFGEDQKGWAKAWNENSYLVENLGNVDETGGFIRMNLSNTQDKLKSEAIDFVSNIPKQASRKLECEIIKYKENEIPFWNIEPYDRIILKLEDCDGTSLTYAYEISSVYYSFADGVEEFTLDY